MTIKVWFGSLVYSAFPPYLAAFTGDNSIVDSRGLVPTDLTGDDLDLSCKNKNNRGQKTPTSCTVTASYNLFYTT